MRSPRAKPDLLPRRLAPRRVPAQDRSRALVDAVLEAAGRVLVERGWEGLTMKEVSALAGVAPGSLYQYFPDKAALVAGLVERQSERELAFQLEHLAQAPPDATVEQLLEHAIRGALAFQASEGPLMRASLEALPHIGRHAALVARVERVAGAMRAMLAARLPGRSARELDLATHVLVNAVHALTHDGVLPRPAWLDDETLARELGRLVRGYLRG